MPIEMRRAEDRGYGVTARGVESAGYAASVGVMQVEPERLDIQALRGIAVLLVLAHHAKVPLIHGGYLGVDVFFVLSGFLITSLVARDIIAGEFSFVRFYWRRAWRLLPAVYATIALCIAAAPSLLTSYEMSDFVAQVWGAITFSANIVLWLQTGYFERGAELKPLLHVWSLSIEEQYYLLLPALLFFVGRSRWLTVASLITAASLTACFFVSAQSVAAAFYWLPTRAWEMGMGSVAALLVPALQPFAQRRNRYLVLMGPLGLLAIAAVTLFPLSKVHPGIDAGIACVATVFILLFPSVLLSRGALAKAAAWVGDRSYSLYLVHWPIFAFLNIANAGGGGVAWQIRVVAIIGSICLAYMMHRLIEQRFRGYGRTAPRRYLWLYLVLAGLSLGCCAAWIGHTKQTNSVGAIRPRAEVSFSSLCAYYTEDTLVPGCQNSPEPTVLLWGDSHAIQLAPGLIAEGAQLVQAARPMCAPLWSLSHQGAEYNRTWGESCMKFNDQVYSRLSDMPTVTTVVLAGQWSNQMDGKVLQRDGTVLTVVGTTPRLVAAGLAQTVARVRSLGKRVVIVEPPPSADFDPRRCNERLIEAVLTFGASNDCSIDRASYEQKSEQMRDMLRDVESQNAVHIVRVAPIMCSSTKCRTILHGTILYRDGGHLSTDGFAMLAKNANILNEIAANAR